jgi:hypothetical protein
MMLRRTHNIFALTSTYRRYFSSAEERKQQAFDWVLTG